MEVHAGLAPKGSPVRYIVVDQAERLVDTALPGVLLRLHELSGNTLPPLHRPLQSLFVGQINRELTLLYPYILEI